MSVLVTGKRLPAGIEEDFKTSPDHVRDRGSE